MKKTAVSHLLGVALLLAAPSLWAYLPSATPESQGVDSAGILDWVTSVNTGATRYAHSFVLLRHGKLVAEGYWKPYAIDRAHCLYSHTKAMTSTAIGLCVDDGLIDLDETVAEIFPEKIPAGADPVVNAIRVRDLLSMNAADRRKSNHAFVEGPSKDWVSNWFGSTFTNKPGRLFWYDSGASFMLAAIVQKKTGRKMFDLLNARIFAPLGIEGAWTDQNPDGIDLGGWGGHMKTRDLALWGQLYLQEGNWNGRQLLSKNWVRLATACQTRNGPGTPDWSQGYGFKFWRCQHDCYRADGAAGQYTIVFPKQDAVLSITAYSGTYQGMLDLVWAKILPALKEAPLPENPAAAQALARTCASLKLPVVEGAREGNAALQGKVFDLAPNQAGLESLRLDRAETGWTVEFRVKGLPSQRVSVGYGEPIESFAQTTTATCDTLGKLLGRQLLSTTGAWKPDGTFEAFAYFTSGPSEIRLTFGLDAAGKFRGRLTRRAACLAVLTCDLVERVAAKSELKFYDIVPYAPGAEARTAADIRAASKTAGLQTFLYSVSLDPRGYPALDHVCAAVASYRKLKAELGDAPVRLGFLLQSILGHWPRVDKKIEPWQRSINEDGEVKRFCVLDTRYQDYIRKTAAALAAEHPCFILGDDDIRAFSHKLECFCPLHTAEFNRRAGTNFTPEAYRAAVKACHEGDRVSTICAQLRDEITLTTTRLIREGIDSVDPSIPAGACMPGAETLLLKPRVKILAGKGNGTTLRFANGKYSEMSRDDFSSNALLTQAYLAHYGKDVDSMLDESDTFPHTLYARSGRSFVAKLAMNVFNGIRGAKLWFVGMHKQSERVPAAYDRELGRVLPQLEALAAVLNGSESLGVRIPAFYRAPSLHAGSPDFFGDQSWVSGLLGVYGVPYCADFSRAPGSPLMLCGAGTINRMSDADLKAAFGGKVFVDGAAAVRLAARGFSADLGCTPVVDATPFNLERICSNGTCPPFSRTATRPLLKNPVPTAEVYSELRYSPVGSAEGPTDLVAPAALCVKRADGGRTFVASFDSSVYYNNQNLRRKAWLVGALRALDPAFPVVCENVEPNLTLARRGRDGLVYAFTLNLGYDDLDATRYSTAKSLANAEVLDADGVWRPAGATLEKGVWTIPGSVPCLSYRIVRW